MTLYVRFIAGPPSSRSYSTRDGFTTADFGGSSPRAWRNVAAGPPGSSERRVGALGQRCVEREEHPRDESILAGEHHQLHEAGDAQLALHLILELLGNRFVGEDVRDHPGRPSVAGGEGGEITRGPHPLDDVGGEA